MWILMLIFFSGPMEISKAELLGYHWNRTSCVESLNEAVEIGLPPNSNIGCIQVKHISRT